jgi:hypothetical protein
MFVNPKHGLPSERRCDAMPPRENNSNSWAIPSWFMATEGVFGFLMGLMDFNGHCCNYPWENRGFSSTWMQV